MSSVKREYPVHIFALLGSALTVAKERMEGLVAGEPTKLRGSHLRLLSMTPTDGVRPTDLAEIVGMTKQSLGEFVATLQQAGYLQTEVDSKDRRARIIRPTPAGAELQQRIMAVFTETENSWREQIGPRKWKAFREVLEFLSEQKLARRRKP